MRPISLMRFNALAAYCRHPLGSLFAEELAWFEAGNERVLGVLVRDVSDDDFGGTVLGRDRKGRYRAISLCGWHASPEQAHLALRTIMERLAAATDEEYYQGDEQGAPLDFFAPLAARDRLSPSFLRLAEDEGYTPARGIIEPMMHWYEDPDGNFIEQFQTTAFDARIWELYLFAAFVEMGFQIQRIHAVPDFTCVGVFAEFAVEAVTVGPTRDPTGATVPPPPRNTPEERLAFEREYMPIKFGSPLITKLGKRYWERANVAGKPLVFAIQDFHAPGSLLISRAALPIYLYGYAYEWEHDRNGKLHIYPRKVATHTWGTKVIPSGFFDQPGAENVSAVLFSNSGTVSKFNRMGTLTGFGSRRVRLIREGFAVDHDPNAATPRHFLLNVNAPEYMETWHEGLEVYHNPHCKLPLDPAALPGAAHHRLLPDGQLESYTPDWHPLSSVTGIALAATLEAQADTSRKDDDST